MAANSFGTFFRITTFGESHGKGIGVVIDGCPAGLLLSEEEIQIALDQRKPGVRPHTSPRHENDIPLILSGLFEGKTTGAPIAIWIENQGMHSDAYTPLQHLYRPGHSNFTYLAKYGIFDYRGGGRSSARETAARVAAGAVAKKLLAHEGIFCTAFLQQIGSLSLPPLHCSFETVQEATKASPLFCPCAETERAMLSLLEQVQAQQDSIGGTVTCLAQVPAGLGDPIYHKIEALLAFAMLSIPASKGFEIGEGFAAAEQRGSYHNDLFDLTEDNTIYLKTNHCGGALGGITTGSPLTFKVAFKPPSSIPRVQTTVSLSCEKVNFDLPPSSKHDPCVAIRAVPVVEAMTALVLADTLLAQRVTRISPSKIL